jgi:hypothetical protein
MNISGFWRKKKEKHVNGKSKSYGWDEAKQIIRGKRKL